MRKEWLQIQEEFTRLQERIDAVRDSVADSLVHLFGKVRPAFDGLLEEALIDRIAGSVVARLGTSPKPHLAGETRYVRDIEAAAFLGVSAHALRAWRSRGKTTGPPFAKIGSTVMYSVKELERFMEERTVDADEALDVCGRVVLKFALD